MADPTLNDLGYIVERWMTFMNEFHPEMFVFYSHDPLATEPQDTDEPGPWEAPPAAYHIKFVFDESFMRNRLVVRHIIGVDDSRPRYPVYDSAEYAFDLQVARHYNEQENIIGTLADFMGATLWYENFIQLLAHHAELWVDVPQMKW